MNILLQLCEDVTYAYNNIVSLTTNTLYKIPRETSYILNIYQCSNK